MGESVVVIGCGPGGMFFCHALEARRRELTRRGDAAGAARLPRVTVYERAGTAGGIWRADRNGGAREYDQEGEEKKEAAAEGHATQMYEALWTNGPKEGIELFDYTFDEHFGSRLPVYLPRRSVLDYMLARVTRNCPDFFEKYVRFDTNVDSVVFDDSAQHFTVTTQHLPTGVVTVQQYDRCVWAAGPQGLPSIPPSLLRGLGRFSGRVLHSTGTARFKEDVAGKRVLMVGGSYSAEDLALMACKVDVRRAYIAARSGSAVVSWMSRWPEDKVECLLNYEVAGAEGSTVLLRRTRGAPGATREPAGEEGKTHEAAEGEVVRLHDIDTVILCTGYKMQFGMLEPRLWRWQKTDPARTFAVPEDWEVAENAMTEKVRRALGDVARPTEALWSGSSLYYPDLYDGVLIENPRMMFLRQDRNDYPILNQDANAWLLVRYVTGRRPLPPPHDMRRRNVDDALLEMRRFPSQRYRMDPGCRAAWTTYEAARDPDGALLREARDHHAAQDFHRLARTMEAGGYPAGLGTFDALNDRGERLRLYGDLSYYHRTRVPREGNRTFRDVEDADRFASVFTGTRSVPMKKLWMDIDENEEKEIW